MIPGHWQDGDANPENPTRLGADALARIAALAAGAVEGCGVLRLTAYEIVAVSAETRLRFNALRRVEAWTLRVTLESPAGAAISGDLELFHWLGDDEWELWHAGLT